MFAKLTGIIDSLADDYIVLDVSGVGYKVFTGLMQRHGLVIGSHAIFFVETIIREDRFDLYGFVTAEEQLCFNLLTKISGVGARVAMAIISTLSSSEITRAAISGDQRIFTTVPGIGAKLSARIASELERMGDKLNNIMLEDFSKKQSNKKIATTAPSEQAPIAEAMTALESLGFMRSEAHSAIMAASDTCSTTPDLPQLIKLALQKLSK